MSSMEQQSRSDDVLKLMEEKDKIEQELTALIESLESQGVGVKGNLVDSEGFPRGDVDVMQIRKQRNRVAILQTDHKDIMNKIEKGLHEVHASALHTSTSNDSSSATNSPVTHAPSQEKESSDSVQNELSQPWAKIDDVSENSPAAQAGLQVGDLVVKLGSVDDRVFSRNEKGGLAAVAEEVQANVGENLAFQVDRGLNRIDLVLVPQPWEGRGLLGCHLTPL